MRFAGIAAREPISGLELVAPEPTAAAALSRVHERFVLAGGYLGPNLERVGLVAPNSQKTSRAYQPLA